MPIDKSGKWWKGAAFPDLVEYVKLLTEDGYPARDVIQSVCECGGRVFRLEAGGECARRTCSACGAFAYIADSEEYADDEEFKECVCPCGGNLFEIGVGFSFLEDGEVRWITVGERCARCGILGVFVDWKISYAPTAHLLRKV